ncbi:hypothetical protein DFH28DRAFT_1090700 [Melampsora americana]|nr:hypothetical protein DFH28DRAFT_1090700 [Melampsora americana]
MTEANDSLESTLDELKKRSSLTPDPENHELTERDWVCMCYKLPLRSCVALINDSLRSHIILISCFQDSEEDEGTDTGNQKSDLPARLALSKVTRNDTPNNQHGVTRTIEITKASRRVRTWQDLYDSTKTRVDAILEEEDPEDDAIVEELAELLKDLEKYNTSISDKKKKLDILIAQGCEGEIEIAVFDPVKIRKARLSGSSAGSPLRQNRPKRQKGNPSYKEAQTRKSKKIKVYKSTEHVTLSDGEEAQDSTTSPPNTPTTGDPSSIFSSDVDLTKIIKDVTVEEAECIQAFTTFLPSNQFNWGLALGPSIRNIIFCWCKALPPLKTAGSIKSLEVHVAKLKEICIHKDMHNFLKTGMRPNLLQLSVNDQFFTQDSLNWEILEASIKHPWSKRSGFFRALHSMACRTDDKLQWTSETSLKSKLNNAYYTLKQILSDSIDLISYHTEHANINISTTGINAVPDDMVDLSKGIGWLYQQIMVRVQGEEENENKKVHKHGIAWLQRRYLLVIIGVMLIYERHVYHTKFIEFINEEERTQVEIRRERKSLKDASCLNQLSLTWVNLHPQRALKSAGKSETPGDAQDLSEDQRKLQATRDASETRSDALRALSLFLLYGTAGLFHVWTNRREVILHDPSHLINMCSIFALRYHNSEHKDKSDFYKHFDAGSLSALFIMDIYDELAKPGQSRSPCGGEAPQVITLRQKGFPDLEVDHNVGDDQCTHDQI